MPASMTQLFIHYVWGTYERTPWLVGSVRQLAYHTIAATCRKLQVQVLALNGMEDHVHLLVKMPPTIAVATLIGKIKGLSSYAVTHQWVEEPFKWQDGYGAFTVSTTMVPVVRGYITNQQSHHDFCHTIMASHSQPAEDANEK